jgi:serine O-acetyltransferase
MNFRSMLADLRADLARHRVGGFLPTAKALLFNLSFQVVLSYRLHRYLASRRFLRLSLLQILISRWQVASGNCQISPRAEIAGGLLLPHPLGVVVGSGCRLGRDVTLYQGVTLGADRQARYPVLEPGVTIYANACVIGGVFVGAGSTVGACSLLRNDLPPGSVAAGVPAKILHRHG